MSSYSRRTQLTPAQSSNCLVWWHISLMQTFPMQHAINQCSSKSMQIWWGTCHHWTNTNTRKRRLLVALWRLNLKSSLVLGRRHISPHLLWCEATGRTILHCEDLGKCRTSSGQRARAYYRAIRCGSWWSNKMQPSLRIHRTTSLGVCSRLYLRYGCTWGKSTSIRKSQVPLKGGCTASLCYLKGYTEIFRWN